MLYHERYFGPNTLSFGSYIPLYSPYRIPIYIPLTPLKGPYYLVPWTLVRILNQPGGLVLSQRDVHWPDSVTLSPLAHALSFGVQSLRVGCGCVVGSLGFRVPCGETVSRGGGGGGGVGVGDGCW